MTTHADRILQFFRKLEWTDRLPSGIELLNPWKEAEVMKTCTAFYQTYFSDNKPRTLLLGINPGRHGGGTTGIAFTDPIRLEQYCGIYNDFPKRPELSSDFIYRVVEAYGGTGMFYRDFYINSVVPLGFMQNGKNFNYYDMPTLVQQAEVAVPGWMNEHLSLGIRRKRCVCLGEGKNLQFLQRMNDKYHWFERIDPLPHPRFIMQYRRKNLEEYINLYIRTLSQKN